MNGKPESETPETDAICSAGFVSSLAALARSLERRLRLAQTEIKGHMRVIDELKAEMVICNGCAFRYGAEHKLADGTYSCPVCELIEAQARIAALEKDAARYRWLRDSPYKKAVRLLDDFHPDALDAALDAALKDRA